MRCWIQEAEDASGTLSASRAGGHFGVQRRNADLGRRLQPRTLSDMTLLSVQQLPTFLYIGPDKAGSTWLYEALRCHPDIYMSAAKELFYFNDHYHRGPRWYLQHFAKAKPGHRVIGEVSHDYLFSVDACHRIANDLSDVRLMACLREPVDRAFSLYLYMVRQGRVSGSFEQALEDMTALVDHGLYAKHLSVYISVFGRHRVHVVVFPRVDAPLV